MPARRKALAALLLMATLLCACPKQQGSTAGGTSTPSAVRQQYSGPFSIEAHSLAEDYLLGQPILTTEPNSFAADELLADGGQACKLQFMPRGIEPIMNVPYKLTGRKRTAMFFPDSRVLVTVAPEAGESPRLLVIDTETGMEIDVSPANIGALWDSREELPLVAWTGKHGLSLFGPGFSADELLLWQGHASLEQVQRIPGCLAWGRRMADDGLQFLIVNSSLELLAFNEASGLLEVDPDGSALAAAIADVAAGERQSPLQFAAADGVAVLMTRDATHWALVGTDDRQDYIEVHAAAGFLPDGQRRTPLSGDLLAGDEATRLRREGAQQPAWIVNEGFVLPVNRSHVGIYDLVYQRLVVIGMDS